MESVTTSGIHETGSQRLPLKTLLDWEALKYGMFIHFGMSTFDGVEMSTGTEPSSLYRPDKLDVDQWISVARDAGMKYAVLTTKHVSGHCLWPSKHTDYHVGTSGNKTDVVEAFVNACERRGIIPGFYYCSWDNHNLFGSVTPSMAEWKLAYTTRAYQEFQSNQIDELLTQYGPVGEVWIDIPRVLFRTYRQELYEQIAGLAPHAVIMMNNGLGDGSTFSIEDTWPTDLITIERFLPNSHTGHVQWREVEGKMCYMPGEVCDPVGKDWFFTEHDRPRSDGELLGMYLTSVTRETNFLLDVGPDKHGLIPDDFVNALMRLQKNIERFGES